MDRKIATLIRGILAATALGGLIALAFNYLPSVAAQSASTELVASSVDGGGGEMSGGSLSMDYAVAEGQPIGQASSASYTLDGGFVPIIAASFASLTPTPVALSKAPSISGWGFAALVAGMLVALLVFLAKSRPRTQAT